MKYDNIQRAALLTRPNRFVAEVEMAGQKEIVHEKNTERCIRSLDVPWMRQKLQV